MNLIEEKPQIPSSKSGRRESKPPLQMCELTETYARLRATSAAPSYFKSLSNARNGKTYLDGAIYHNNPVQVADIERRLIWPETRDFPPDILLSIGTGCSKKIREAAKIASTHQELSSNLKDPPLVTTNSVRHRIFKKKSSHSQTRNYLQLAKDRVESLLDPEIAWLTFASMASRASAESRYRRINPDIGFELPRLDEVDIIPYLREKMRQVKKGDGFQMQVRAIARNLVASCFYADIPKLASPQDLHVTGMSFQQYF